ncbi:unnamed protein product [Lathyrus oleraceus]
MNMNPIHIVIIEILFRFEFIIIFTEPESQNRHQNQFANWSSNAAGFRQLEVVVSVCKRLKNKALYDDGGGVARR